MFGGKKQKNDTVTYDYCSCFNCVQRNSRCFVCTHSSQKINILLSFLPAHILSQVQSIKQNNSSLKQSISEGLDIYRPAEVSPFSPPFSHPSSLPSLICVTCLYSRLLNSEPSSFCLLPLSFIHYALPQLPPDIIPPPRGTEIKS